MTTTEQVNPIKAARLKAGISQAELAKRAGISRQSVNYAEQGRHTPHRDTLYRIARALDVPPSELGEPTDPADRERWFVKGLLQEVEAGELSAFDALDALQDAGLLQKRRRPSTRAI